MTKAFKSGHLLEFDELQEELDLISKKIKISIQHTHG